MNKYVGQILAIGSVSLLSVVLFLKFKEYKCLKNNDLNSLRVEVITLEVLDVSLLC